MLAKPGCFDEVRECLERSACQCIGTLVPESFALKTNSCHQAPSIAGKARF